MAIACGKQPFDLAKDVRTETERFSHCLRLDDWHEPPLKNVSYDPKTRSTSGDNPVPDTDPKDKFNAGDSQNRTSRGVLKLKQHIRKRALDDPFEMGQDLEHMQWGYPKAKILNERYWAAREKKLKEKCYTIIDEYGNEKQIPIKDYNYRFFKSRKMAITWKKYEEDIYNNNHTTVWGSWWKDHQWGYKCCKQIVRNSYCTGTAGFEAAEATTDLMKADIARKQAIKDQRMSAFEAAEAATDLMKADIARKQAIKVQRAAQSAAFEAARRAALFPDEVVDEDGKEFNPHIPKYVPNAPWYLSAEVNV